MFRFPVALFLVFVVSPVLAVNDEVRSCSLSQIRQVVNAIESGDFIGDYEAIVDDMKTVGENPDILYALIEDMSALQATWWNDIVASFPTCALANEMALTGGHMLDELLIATSLGRLAYSEILDKNEDRGNTYLGRFQYHIGQWTDIQDEFIELIEDMKDA